MEDRPTDWYWEGNVQDTLAAYLSWQGWSLVQMSNTLRREHGVDLLLERDERRLAIEVKGYPSRTYSRGPNQGLIKPSSPDTQARHWFSHALLSAMSYYSEASGDIAIGLPDFQTYRGLLSKTIPALIALGIGVYVVSENGEVETVIAPGRDRLESE